MPPDYDHKQAEWHQNDFLPLWYGMLYIVYLPEDIHGFDLEMECEFRPEYLRNPSLFNCWHSPKVGQNTNIKVHNA